MALSRKDRVKSGTAFPVRIAVSHPGWILGAVSTLEALLLFNDTLDVGKVHISQVLPGITGYHLGE